MKKNAHGWRVCVYCLCHKCLRIRHKIERIKNLIDHKIKRLRICKHFSKFRDLLNIKLKFRESIKQLGFSLWASTQSFKMCRLERSFHIVITNVVLFSSPTTTNWDLTIHPLGAQRSWWHTAQCLIPFVTV